MLIHKLFPAGLSGLVAAIGAVTASQPMAAHAQAADPTEAATSAAVEATDLPEIKLASATAGWVPGDESGLHVCPSRPGTLFQWSYGNSFSGGPNLDEPLVTDRPDFTEASTTVGDGVLQIEAGYTYTYDREDGESTRSQSLGEPLFRYGMFAEWFEWRLAVFPVSERVSSGGARNTDDGVEDIYFGAKIGLTPQEGILPEMSLIPQATIPTGKDVFSADELLPGVNWIYAWEISDDVSIAGSTQFNRAIDDATGGAYTEWAQSGTMAVSLTDEWGMYNEFFALFPHSADTAMPEYYYNGGFTYLLSNDIQWDIRGGYGLNSNADDYFFGTGVSLRFH